MQRGPKLIALTVPVLQIFQTAGRMGQMQGAGAGGFALNAFVVDEVKDQIRRAAQHINQMTPRRLAHLGQDHIRWQPKPGIDQPDVAT